MLNWAVANTKVLQFIIRSSFSIVAVTLYYHQFSKAEERLELKRDQYPPNCRFFSYHHTTHRCSFSPLRAASVTSLILHTLSYFTTKVSSQYKTTNAAVIYETVFTHLFFFSKDNAVV